MLHDLAYNRQCWSHFGQFVVVVSGLNNSWTVNFLCVWLLPIYSQWGLQANLGRLVHSLQRMCTLFLKYGMVWDPAGKCLLHHESPSSHEANESAGLPCICCTVHHSLNICKPSRTFSSQTTSKHLLRWVFWCLLNVCPGQNRFTFVPSHYHWSVPMHFPKCASSENITFLHSYAVHPALSHSIIAAANNCLCTGFLAGLPTSRSLCQSVEEETFTPAEAKSLWRSL